MTPVEDSLSPLLLVSLSVCLPALRYFLFAFFLNSFFCLNLFPVNNELTFQLLILFILTLFSFVCIFLFVCPTFSTLDYFDGLLFRCFGVI